MYWLKAFLCMKEKSSIESKVQRRSSLFNPPATYSFDLIWRFIIIRSMGHAVSPSGSETGLPMKKSGGVGGGSNHPKNPIKVVLENSATAAGGSTQDHRA
jgi:hypothetical protein